MMRNPPLQCREFVGQRFVVQQNGAQLHKGAPRTRSSPPPSQS